MILINLLPHREERRRQRKRIFFAGLVLSGALGAGIAGVWYVVLLQMTSTQEQRNSFLSAEIKRLESQIKDIAELKSEIESLKARQKAVEDLQLNRNVPVYLLDELVRYTPDGIYYTGIKQAGDLVTVSGIAQSNERVSELLRNAQHRSQWLRQPELVEIKSVQLPTSPGGRESRRLYDFSVRVSVKQASTPVPERPASAASAPRKAT